MGLLEFVCNVVAVVVVVVVVVAVAVVAVVCSFALASVDDNVLE